MQIQLNTVNQSLVVILSKAKDLISISRFFGTDLRMTAQGDWLGIALLVVLLLNIVVPASVLAEGKIYSGQVRGLTHGVLNSS